MYDRIKQWEGFSFQVSKHIIQYTLPQYGDSEGTEQIEEFSVEDCFQHMTKYINRRKASVRGNKERLRDLLKIAHYANFAYDKLKEELSLEDVYE